MEERVAPSRCTQQSCQTAVCARNPEGSCVNPVYGRKKKITEPKMNRKNPSEITKMESKSLTEKFVINTSKF